MAKSTDKSLVDFLNARKTADTSFDVPEYMSKFSYLTSNAARIDFVYEDMLKYNLTPSWTRDIKHDEIAAIMRRVGDFFSEQGKYIEAVKVYTKSIGVVRNTNTLAQHYAARAEVLAQMGFHGESLRDVSRALHNRHIIKASHEIRIAEGAVDLMSLSPGYHEPRPIIPETHRNHSASIKIRRSHGPFGTHIVATKTIEIGEVLLVEKPFASLLTEDLQIHCHECLELCFDPVPCLYCTTTFFCSTKCRHLAWVSYHYYDCSILPSLNKLFGIGSTTILAVKVALKLRNYYNDLQNYPNHRIHRCGITEICNLVTHLDKATEAELLETAIKCARILHLVKNYTNFLYGCNLPLMAATFKELLFAQIHACSVNELEIMELVPSHSGFYDRKPVGVGVYPTASLFNHSCYPNVIKINYGNVVVVRALSPMEAGQQCFMSYGPHYHHVPGKELRQSHLLQKYRFICRCKACEGGWPRDPHKPCKTHYLNNLPVFSAIFSIVKAKVSRANIMLPSLEAALRMCANLKGCNSLMLCQYLVTECYTILGNRRPEVAL